MADIKDINCIALIAAESLKKETRRGPNIFMGNLLGTPGAPGTLWVDASSGNVIKRV